jgi:hypothetical protein
VDLNGDFMLPGAELPDPGEAHVELLVGGVYDVTTGCRLDGVVATGAPERLEAGGHALSGDRPCTVRLHVDHAARALLEVPTAVPYLSGPDYIVR